MSHPESLTVECQGQTLYLPVAFSLEFVFLVETGKPISALKLILGDDQWETVKLMPMSFMEELFGKFIKIYGPLDMSSLK